MKNGSNKNDPKTPTDHEVRQCPERRQANYSLKPRDLKDKHADAVFEAELNGEQGSETRHSESSARAEEIKSQTCALTSTENWIVQSNPLTDSNTKAGSNSGVRPAIEAPGQFVIAYDHYNTHLWDGELPDCIFTYTRKRRTIGYFAPERLTRDGAEKASELAINPGYIKVLEPIDVHGVLVHEMAHVWRYYIGPLNRNGKRHSSSYHCKIWAAEMKRIGLCPSNTGEPGGNETGYQMMHYIIPDGPFEKAFQSLQATGFRFSWHDAVRGQQRNPWSGDNGNPTKKPNRLKFTCFGCQQNAWAKPSAKLSCGYCIRQMVPVVGAPSTPKLRSRG